ncbi:MAG: 2TM domain-containing protein, partial [Polyangiaceae bacterium]
PSGDDALRARIIRKRRRGFLYHLISYIGVNLIIISPMFMKDLQGTVWALFIPAIGWGIGLAIHALKAYSSEVEDEELRHQIARDERNIARDAARRAALASRLERHARRGKMKKDAQAIGAALEDGVASVLDAAAARIRAGGGGERRVRVEPKPVTERTSRDVAAEREAELEAEAEESAAVARNRRR